MPILSEIATMTEVAQGTSLARFGDGELMIMAGKDGCWQCYNKYLADELNRIINDSPCLVAVPHDKITSEVNWREFLKKYGRPIKLDRWYGSAFVSRDDWIKWTPLFRLMLEKIWRNRNIFFVGHKVPRLLGAKTLSQYAAKKRNTFDHLDSIEEYIVCESPNFDVVILSCGPTATVLADRLARKGIWAVDLGNFAKFL